MKSTRYVLYYDVDRAFSMYILVFFLLRACSFWDDVVIQIHGNCTEFSEIFEIYVGNEYNILVIHNE